MKYYLGIDGGGTKTSFCVLDSSESVYLSHTSQRSSIDTVTVDETLDVFRRFLDELEITIDGIFIGLGGVMSNAPNPLILEFFRTHPLTKNAKQVILKNDIENAFLSGGFTDQGLAVIVGTGSVAYGKNFAQSHRAGGWSFYEGDEGSAYDLGMQAILNTIKVFDHRKTKSPFFTYMMMHIGLKEAQDVARIAQYYRLNRTETAQLAKIVTQYAEKKDDGATEILERGAQSIVDAIKAVHSSVSLKETECVVVGSLGLLPLYFERIQLKLKHENIPVTLVTPVMKPEYAAALFVLKIAALNAS